MSNGQDVSLLSLEARRDVGRNVLVALLKTSVLLDISEVVTTNNDRLLHLGGDADSLQDTSTNRHVSGERTFLVDVVSLDRGLRGLESQTNVLVEARLLSLSLAENSFVRTHEDCLLFHERSLILVETMGLALLLFTGHDVCFLV